MSVDVGNVLLRVLILFFAAGASELALNKRLWALSFFLFAVWLTIFRLTIFRVASVYLGVFSHEIPSFVDTIRVFIQSSPVANATDFVILAGTVGVFRWVAKYRNMTADKK